MIGGFVGNGVGTPLGNISPVTIDSAGRVETLKALRRDLGDAAESIKAVRVDRFADPEWDANFRTDNGRPNLEIVGAVKQIDRLGPAEILKSLRRDAAAQSEQIEGLRADRFADPEWQSARRTDRGPQIEVLTDQLSDHGPRIETAIDAAIDVAAQTEATAANVGTASAVTLEEVQGFLADAGVPAENVSNVVVQIADSGLPFEILSDVPAPFSGSGVALEFINDVTGNGAGEAEWFANFETDQAADAEDAVAVQVDLLEPIETLMTRVPVWGSPLEVLLDAESDAAEAAESLSMARRDAPPQIEIVQSVTRDGRASFDVEAQQQIDAATNDEWVRGTVTTDAIIATESLIDVPLFRRASGEWLSDQQFDGSAQAEATIDVIPSDSGAASETLAGQAGIAAAQVEWMESVEPSSSGAAAQVEILAEQQSDSGPRDEILRGARTDKAAQVEKLMDQRTDSGVASENLGSHVFFSDSGVAMEWLSEKIFASDSGAALEFLSDQAPASGAAAEWLANTEESDGAAQIEVLTDVLGDRAGKAEIMGGIASDSPVAEANLASFQSDAAPQTEIQSLVEPHSSGAAANLEIAVAVEPNASGSPVAFEFVYSLPTQFTRGVVTVGRGSVVVTITVIPEVP